MNEEEQIDAELRALGYDPKEVVIRGRVLISALVANQELRSELSQWIAALNSQTVIGAKNSLDSERRTNAILNKEIAAWRAQSPCHICKKHGPPKNGFHYVPNGGENDEEMFPCAVISRKSPAVEVERAREVLRDWTLAPWTSPTGKDGEPPCLSRDFWRYMMGRTRDALAALKSEKAQSESAWECAKHKTFGPSYLKCAACVMGDDAALSSAPTAGRGE